MAFHCEVNDFEIFCTERVELGEDLEGQAKKLEFHELLLQRKGI